LKCSIEYDGDVNTVARAYTVTDHHSKDTPNKIGALRANIPEDDTFQDWVVDKKNSISDCPFLQPCTFQCSASRRHVTYDKNDLDFTSQSGVEIYVGYFVYVGSDELFAGWHEFSKFVIPLGAYSLATNALTLVLTAVSLW
jgi:hypothetical protein